MIVVVSAVSGLAFRLKTDPALGSIGRWLQEWQQFLVQVDQGGILLKPSLVDLSQALQKWFGWTASLSRPANVPSLAALLFRFEPVETIKNFLGQRVRRGTEPAQLALLPVTAPHGFILVEAMDEFLRVNERRDVRWSSHSISLSLAGKSNQISQ